MRVHANQINPNLALDAMYAAQKAAAKRETARTRKKLMESASELAGEAEEEGWVVKVGGQEDYDKPPEEDRQNDKRKAGEDAKNADESISDWA